MKSSKIFQALKVRQKNSDYQNFIKISQLIVNEENKTKHRNPLNDRVQVYFNSLGGLRLGSRLIKTWHVSKENKFSRVLKFRAARELFKCVLNGKFFALYYSRLLFFLSYISQLLSIFFSSSSSFWL